MSQHENEAGALNSLLPHQLSSVNHQTWQITTTKAALHQVILQAHYRCAKERCSTNHCQCHKAGLLCTDLCSSSDDDDECENQQGECDDDDSDIEDEEDDDALN